MLPLQTVRVVANPFNALDERGEPCCAVAFEDAPRAYLGATRTDILGAPVPLHEADGVTYAKVTFAFDARPRGVPLSSFTRRRVRDRDWLPADAESAAALGVAPFVAPEKALTAAADEAAARWKAQHGVLPAWAQPAPAAPVQTPKPAAKAAPAET